MIKKADTVNVSTGEVLPSGTPKGNPRAYIVNGKNLARKVTHPEANERMAKQEFRKEADINHIMEKYKQTGLLPQQVNVVQSHFADFANVEDYYTACSKATDAQRSFDELPSGTRKMFNNDPAQLVAFVTNPKNELAAAKLGLLTEDATKVAWDKARDQKAKNNDKIISDYESKKTSTKVQKKDPEGS